MNLGVIVDVQGVTVVVDDLLSVSKLLDDDSEIMLEIGQLGMAKTAHVFEAQGIPVPWDPPSEATLEARRARGEGGSLALIDTGQLLGSFVGEGNQFTIFHVGPGEVFWGSSRPDLPFHDKGTATEPQRQILVHSPGDEEDYADLYLERLVEAFG